MAAPARRVTLAFALSGVAFAGLGLPDSVLGVAWPSLRQSFELSPADLGSLLVATTTGYVSASAVSGAVVARIGVGVLLALSCALTSISLLGYALAPRWLALVGCGALAGIGAGAIDAGINAHAATRFSPRAVSLLHACYGVGTTAGPAIVTAILLAGHSWRVGYALLSVVQLGLALAFAGTLRCWPSAAAAATSEKEIARRRSESAAFLAQSARLPGVYLGVVCFAIYTGLEAAAGAWLYSWQVESRGASLARAGAMLSSYWGGLFAGRLALALLPPPRSIARRIRVSAAGITSASALLALGVSPAVEHAAAAALGAFAGPIFPLLIASTRLRVPRAHVPNAIGFEIAAAAAGQALLPGGIGLLVAAQGVACVPLAFFAAAVVLCAGTEGLERWAPPGAEPAQAGPALPGERRVA